MSAQLQEPAHAGDPRQLHWRKPDHTFDPWQFAWAANGSLTGQITHEDAVPIDHYLPAATYTALIEALTSMKADPATGQIEPHCFPEILGEIGGIWPATVLDDPDRDEGIDPAALALTTRRDEIFARGSGVVTEDVHICATHNALMD